MGVRAGELAIVHGPFGEVKYLLTRVAYSTLRPRLDRSAEPLGASPLAWRTRTPRPVRGVRGHLDFGSVVVVVVPLRVGVSSRRSPGPA
ncbi:hypothetical protein JG491_01060 [Streptomyces sp. CRPSP2-6A1]|uniref:hypothetical protein n=1 Tax=Streptomyces sp. CRPSP2-6A1 TaxID=2799588 RepID=UPI0018F0CD3B|nr:hypothetical protein [Streptomyces sp. CRPSP2-6A1]MBJ6998687.1 hypothetical protein [Streptomyces sp. CRPSP2-6A1]